MLFKTLKETPRKFLFLLERQISLISQTVRSNLHPSIALKNLLECAKNTIDRLSENQEEMMRWVAKITWKQVLMWQQYTGWYGLTNKRALFYSKRCVLILIVRNVATALTFLRRFACSWPRFSLLQAYPVCFNACVAAVSACYSFSYNTALIRLCRLIRSCVWELFWEARWAEESSRFRFNRECCMCGVSVRSAHSFRRFSLRRVVLTCGVSFVHQAHAFSRISSRSVVHPCGFHLIVQHMHSGAFHWNLLLALVVFHFLQTDSYADTQTNRQEDKQVNKQENREQEIETERHTNT